ncbi:hypothetical protein ACIO53_15315 [Streptomyces sp. NPDC087305]|uniref:hypothetical protein n=1 Tax=Streptomyces sp. NPDC087305 TaxID=3365781 RepID=UPI003812A4A4
MRPVHSLRRELRGDDGHVTKTAVRGARTADRLNAACPPPGLPAARPARRPARPSPGLAAACGEAE